MLNIPSRNNKIWIFNIKAFDDNGSNCARLLPSTADFGFLRDETGEEPGGALRERKTFNDVRDANGDGFLDFDEVRRRGQGWILLIGEASRWLIIHGLTVVRLRTL